MNIDADKDALPLALTMGDPAGIGPDISLTCWLERQKWAGRNCPPFFFIGSLSVLESRAKLLNMDVPFKVISTPEEALTVFKEALPVLELEEVVGEVTPGKPSREAAFAVIASISRAVEYVEAGQAAAVVTNPIAKEVLYAAGFQFPGHTEFLAHLASKSLGHLPHPVMMIASDELSVVPVTIHIPLKEAAGQLSASLISQTGEIVWQDMQRFFGLEDPRIAITGVNPHAGEGGKMGREEIEVIKPAIDYLFKKGIDVTGPHPADTLFHAEARKNYDVVIGMYHDQVLVPAKTLAFDKGVNITLGLPFVRTSPDHGTAFGIAGQPGKARATSLLCALRKAREMARHVLTSNM